MSAPYVSFFEEIEEKGYHFSSVLLKLSNSLIVFFYEGVEMKLGTLAVALPQFNERTSISSILLGERNMNLTKILAERFSNSFQGVVLVSTHLAEVREIEVSSILFKLTQKLFAKIGLN